MTGKLMELVNHFFKGDQYIEPVEDDFVYDETAPAIEDVITNIMKDVPQEDLDMLPDNFIDNLDYYLYGYTKE